MNNYVRLSFLTFFVVFVFFAYDFLGDATKVDLEEDVGENLSLDREGSGRKNELIDKAEQINCVEFFDGKKLNKSWHVNNYKYIKKLYKDMESKGANATLLDLIAVKSGIGLYKGRSLRSDYRNDFKKPPYFSGEVVLANFREHKIVDDFISSKEIKPLLKAIRDGRLRDNATYSGKKSILFLLSFILESKIDNKEQIVESLLGENILVTHLELINMSKAGFPIRLIEYAYMKSNINANKVLKYYGRYSSLAMEAIRNKDFDAVVYWMEKGSPTQPDIMGLNALDFLVKYGSHFDQEERQVLFDIMLDYGINLYHNSFENKLSELVSKESFDTYLMQVKDRSKLVSNLLSNAEKEKLEEISGSIHRKVLDKVVDFKLDLYAQDACTLSLGRKLVKLAMKPLPNKNKNKSLINISDQALLTKNALISSRVAKAKEKYVNSEDVEAFLGESQSLEDKMAVEKYRQEEVAEAAKEALEKLNKGDFTESQKSNIEKVKKLIELGHWNEAISLLQQHGEKSQELMTSILLLAISNGADFNIVKHLINEGGVLLPDTIHILAQKDNVEMAKNLLKYNLNIHSLDVFQHSAVYNAVNYKSLDMLEFLLSKRVKVNSSSDGLDALDIAIKKCKNITDIIYIRLLLEADATIERSHKQQVQKIKDKDFFLYLKIVGAFPGLIMQA